MLINDSYELLQELANKDETSGYITPEDFNKYAYLAQLEIIGSFYNNPRGYNPQLREPRKAYDTTQDISDTLKSLKTTTILQPNSEGDLTEPSDYMHFSSAMVNYNDTRDGEQVPTTTIVELLRDSELAERLSSEFERPSMKFPAVVQYSDKWKVYPKEVEQIQLTYLKYPLIPWWNYTEVSGRPVFAETGGITTNPNSGITAGDSTDFELPEGMIYELVYKLCQYMGISVRDADLYQTSVNQPNIEG